MRVVTYVCLHYGAQWLEYALKSVQTIVDDVIVVYSDHPSHGHGHGTNATKPAEESRERLKALALPYISKWYDAPTQIRHEWQHRQYAIGIARNEHDAAIVHVLDADEVWDAQHLNKCIQTVKYRHGERREWRVRFRHFWRSVWWVCNDDAMPVRFVDLTSPNAGDAYMPDIGHRVNHFGYAQTPDIIAYKWKIHGHLPELRRDWFQRQFLQWSLGEKDVHPTNINYWNPEPFDASEIKHLIGDHPFYGLPIIR